MYHPSSDIQSHNIGEGTVIWQFCVVLPNAQIGKNCNINAFVFIENDVIIGDRVTVKSGVQLWDGLRLENDVFVGPNVTFTNDSRPRSKQYPSSFPKTYVREKASIGANSTILPGLEIGAFSMVGAGSIVTKSIPSRALVIGTPAKVVAWLNEDGSNMKKVNQGWQDNKGEVWIEKNGKLSIAG